MRSLLVILILTNLFIFAPSAQAAIVDIHVYSAADSGTSTLRQAILDGNALVGDAPRILIHLDSSNPILLQSPLPTLTAPVFYIEGALPGRARIKGQDLYNILEVAATVLLLRLENVGLYEGRSSDGRAACLHIAGNTGYATLDNVWMASCHHSTDTWAYGGAIQAERDLTILDSVFQFNRAIGTSDVAGAAVALLGSDSDLVIENSYFGSNYATTGGAAGTADGGAIFVDFGSSLTIHDSVFSSNGALASNSSPAASRGGALYALLSGTAEIERTAFTDNRANTGGAIYHYNYNGDATLFLHNCTIYSNVAATGIGGALYFGHGALSLRSNTFWKNSAYVAGDNLATDNPGSIHIDSAYNNLFTAGEGVGDSCAGFYTTLSSGYNIVPAVECGIGTGSGDLVTTEPHIRGAYTGPGLDHTIELYANSPALDAGNPIAPDDNGFSACPETDMLGQPRPVDASATGAPARCDIGALEAQSEPSLFIDDFEPRWRRP